MRQYDESCRLQSIEEVPENLGDVTKPVDDCSQHVINHENDPEETLDFSDSNNGISPSTSGSENDIYGITIQLNGIEIQRQGSGGSLRKDSDDGGSGTEGGEDSDEKDGDNSDETDGESSGDDGGESSTERRWVEKIVCICRSCDTPTRI